MHRVDFLKAFDRRHPDPAKNYGMHGVETRFYAIGEGRTVQLVIYTNWMLSDVESDGDGYPFRRRGWHDGILCQPMPADLGYHSAVPMYEGQDKMDKCEFIPGGCYYDGSGLNAYKPTQILVREGGDALWAFLDNYWREVGERGTE